MRRVIASMFIATLLAGTGTGTVQGQQASEERVAAQIQLTTSALAGVTGVAAQVVGGTSSVFLNGDTAFPMASTYKIAIAMALLHKVDQGEISLDEMVPISPEAIVFSKPIASNFIHPGIALSVANLLEVMIVHSDNTATDALLGLVDGPGEVTKWLRTVGIQDMRLDRSTADLLRDFYGVEPGLAHLAEVGQKAQADPALVIAAQPSFEADPRDQATPRAMLKLLITLVGEQALSANSSALLLGIMGRTITVPQRIPGLLPPGTATARKSGTIGGVANDVGFVTLPDGRKLALVVFTKSSATPPESRDLAVAEAARILYDYFVIHW